MTRVLWTPKTNTQRSALARFGTDWQINETASPFPTVIGRGNGQQCWFIHPVGNPDESRWVPVSQVKFKEGVA